MTIELPPLPEPADAWSLAAWGPKPDYFTAEQMAEYANAVAEARERILLARIAELERLWQSAEARYAEADAAAMAHAKRIAELEAENASLRQHLRVAAGDILRLASTREALTNQLDALRADQDDDNA